MPRRANTLTVSALFAILGLTQSALSSDPPSGIIPMTPEEMRTNIPFSGKLAALDFSANAFGVEISGKQYVIYVTANTKITRRGKPATLKSGRIGDYVSGFEKIVKGKSVAISVGFGYDSWLYPFAIPVKGRPGFVTSPYAPKAAPLDVSNRIRGDEIRDPYTGKIFLVP